MLVWCLLLGVGCVPSRPADVAQSAQVSDPSPSTTPEMTAKRNALTPCREDSASACAAGDASPGDTANAGRSVDSRPSPASPRPKATPLDESRRYEVALLPDDPYLGNENAPVTLVVFSDFQCPYCSRLTPVISELRSRFGDDLRVVWKDLPLANHVFAEPAAALARQAYAIQGNAAFWQLHDELFSRQSQFSDAWLSQLARDNGLSWPPPESYSARVRQNVLEADRLNIRATPTTFINGRPVVGAKHVSAYSDVIQQELEPAW